MFRQVFARIRSSLSKAWEESGFQIFSIVTVGSAALGVPALLSIHLEPLTEWPPPFRTTSLLCLAAVAVTQMRDRTHRDRFSSLGGLLLALTALAVQMIIVNVVLGSQSLLHLPDGDPQWNRAADAVFLFSAPVLWLVVWGSFAGVSKLRIPEA